MSRFLLRKNLDAKDIFNKCNLKFVFNLLRYAIGVTRHYV